MSSFAKAVVDATLYGYAIEYVHVDGKPFSFTNHNYLIAPYQDNHPYQVIEKAAQMGGSVLGMIKALYVCDKLGKNVIYFFPTDEDVRDFSKSRMKPIITDSPHLKAIVGDADAVGLRNVGRGFLYFRGMRSSIRAKSVPADLLVFDELDEVTDEQKDLADKRLNHSDLKWRYMLSTPTFDNYGIDREFQTSDQQHWNLVCRKCNTRNILEKTFPGCIRRVSETKAILICRKCEAQLDPQYGLWLPERKTDRKRGYHFCGLFNHYADLSQMLYTFEEGRNREEFMRSDLGLPWVSSDQKLTPEVVERCIEKYDNGTIKQSHAYMGVDQRGRELHYVVRGQDPSTRKPKVLACGRVTKFGDLDPLMRIHDVDLCVIDGLPNQHSAREFSTRFPGRVFLAYYHESQKGSYKWVESKTTDEDFTVTVNRTEALDAMYEEITRRDVEIPQDNDKETHDFILHICNLARMNERDDDGNVKAAVYKRLGEDHYAHANSYALIAQTRFGKPATSILLQSPVIGTTFTSRRFEQGSPF